MYIKCTLKDARIDTHMSWQVVLKRKWGYIQQGALPSSTHKLARVVLEFAIVKCPKYQAESVEYTTAVSAARVDRSVRG